MHHECRLLCQYSYEVDDSVVWLGNQPLFNLLHYDTQISSAMGKTLVFSVAKTSTFF